MNETENNDFSLDKFLDKEGNMDDYYSSSPSFFEVVEEVKVNHGLFVSTRQVAETFFHQLVPSQTVKVLLNPDQFSNNNFFLVEKPNHHHHHDDQERPSSDFYGKLKTFAKLEFEKISKQVNPCLKVASVIFCIIALILIMSDIWFMKQNENFVRIRHDQYNSKVLNEVNSSSCVVISKIGKNKKKRSHEIVDIRGGNSIISLFLMKIGVFLTISLGLCTIWA